MQRENIKTIPTFPRFYITHNPLLLSEQGKNVPLSKEMKQNLSDFGITWILCFQTHQYIVDNCPLQDAVCQLATCTAQIMKFFISSIKCSYLVLMQHFPAEFVKSRAMCITRASVVYVLSFPRATCPKRAHLPFFLCQRVNVPINAPTYQSTKGVPIFELGVPTCQRACQFFNYSKDLYFFVYLIYLCTIHFIHFVYLKYIPNKYFFIRVYIFIYLTLYVVRKNAYLDKHTWYKP